MGDPSPLDDVEFLARSGHRVEVLRTLASGPRTRPEVHRETGVSQPTLGRILGSFEERHWVERRGSEYTLTPSGTLVWEQFDDLLDTVETAQRLADVVEYLPTDELGFDVRELAEATITTPVPGDGLRHLRRLEEVVYTADVVRNVAPTAPPGARADFENRFEAFMRSDQQVEAIVSTGALRVSADAEMMGRLRTALGTNRVDLYRYDGPVPVMLALVDGTAVLAPLDDDGVPTATIESDDEAVRAWVASRLDEYRERATRISPDDLPS
ncbi:helix-turn-helix transcriptional regulator [Halomarina oriensis]|uniref:ArsR family transcriptional regulator n=1 Tax=Halomarina oriensis TaxID=671145 RepID=A0A6B0GLD2_9EURY|nr:ArsR family transcriptional regulator [Halomarina oriensis]MWG35736.1 ArsR family transcriptional regulator [Halomarina oriensis]